MQREHTTPRRYEEWAYVLDSQARARSVTMRGREGIIVTAIGEGRMTLLEILGISNSTFEVGEKIYIGKNEREKVQAVLGKISYSRLSNTAKSELRGVIAKLVSDNEKRFIEYINQAQPLTPRIHALALIPGVGRTYMEIIIEERKKKKFESFDELRDRVGFKEPARHIAQRIVDEITGETRINLFAKK